MNPDGVSLLCDDGAHERCLGCECACHLYPSPAFGGAGEAQPPGVGDDVASPDDPSIGDVGSSSVKVTIDPSAYDNWRPTPPHAHMDEH